MNFKLNFWLLLPRAIAILRHTVHNLTNVSRNFHEHIVDVVESKHHREYNQHLPVQTKRASDYRALHVVTLAVRPHIMMPLEVVLESTKET